MSCIEPVDKFNIYVPELLDRYSVGSKIGNCSNISKDGFAILSNILCAQPLIGQAMRVVSTSIDDDVNGIGVRQVILIYFTQSWEKKVEIIDLNGINSIITLNNDIYRIERFQANWAGSIGVAVGKITLKSLDNTLLFAQIEPQTTLFERAIHYIERRYTTKMVSAIISCSTDKAVIFRIFRTEETISGRTLTMGQESFQLINNTILIVFDDAPIIVDNLRGINKSIGIAVKSNVNGQSATASFRYIDFPISAKRQL